MKTWDEAVGQTWLSKATHVVAVDQWVRETLGDLRGMDKNGRSLVAPWTVASLVKSVREFGNTDAWLWCIAAISITQELIFCAEAGGIDPAGVAMDRDLNVQVKALRTIRNVVFHPALQIVKSGKPPAMEDAISLLRNDDNDDVVRLAKRLPNQWASFAERPIAAYALRKLGSAGELFIIKMRLLHKR